MGMTMTQKILAAHAGLESVKAGQLIMADLDMVLANDITGPVSIAEFDGAGFDSVFDKSKVSLVMDHFVPNKDIKSAEQCKACRTFAKRFDIDNFYDVGEMGIEHAISADSNSKAASYVCIADVNGNTYWGVGTHTDIILASVNALVSALNRMNKKIHFIKK